MRREIVRQYERGGLTTVSWHPRNPLTGGDAWDVSDPGTVRSVLPGGRNHAKFLGWVDLAADFLNSLSTNDGTTVPVLFRPWHEHTGSWFWWGQRLCSTAEYEALWKMTVERMRDRGVRMLTVYSPNPCVTGLEYLERYPGDRVDYWGWMPTTAAMPGHRHAARGIARDHGSDRPRPPETLCRIGNRHGGYSACRLVDGGTDAGHRGAASRIRTGMEECLTDAKTRAFLRTLSRTGLAGRLQPVLMLRHGRYSRPMQPTPFNNKQYRLNFRQ